MCTGQDKNIDSGFFHTAKRIAF
uniref:Uncharacterized protein n=1 Tax=Anguilla anguilla TaxID=7936 RepID=A0A0E9UM83_ANGAN